MSSSLSLPLNPTLPHKAYFVSPHSHSCFSLLLKRSSHSLHFHSLVSHCSNNPSNEEQRWLREEQRWLREEQRWLREEQRWARERDSLLRQIADLNLQIQALQCQVSAQDVSSSSSAVSDAIANFTAVLEVLKEKNDRLIAESGVNSRPMVLEEKRQAGKEIEKQVVVEETARVSNEKNTEKRNALRKGSEGDDVREMQEALLKLGFYSGEEDMEYSSFSSGTERAVKTWQAASGAPEDGIMTAELLERLYVEIRIKDSDKVDQKENPIVLPKGGANGATVTSMTEISGVQETITEKGDTEVDLSHQRVFLLGENRWEDASRLVANARVDRSKMVDRTKCLQCRGEGRLLCTECDGTGEPNIEPQFMEWVDEGSKCPYCEGLGYTVCDLCEGKP